MRLHKYTAELIFCLAVQFHTLEAQALLLTDYNNKGYEFKCNMYLFPFPHFYSIVQKLMSKVNSDVQVNKCTSWSFCNISWKEMVFKLWFSNHS